VNGVVIRLDREFFCPLPLAHLSFATDTCEHGDCTKKGQLAAKELIAWTFTAKRDEILHVIILLLISLYFLFLAEDPYYSGLRARIPNFVKARVIGNKGGNGNSKSGANQKGCAILKFTSIYGVFWHCRYKILEYGSNPAHARSF
jgi:hypothetical protein